MPVDTITYTTYDFGAYRNIVYEGTDHLAGKHYRRVRTFDVGYDPETVKESIRLSMDEKQKDREVETWLEDEELSVAADHATKQRHASTWRARYKEAVRDEHFRLGYKMYRDYLLANFTNAQLRTAFDMTQNELDDFMSRVLVAHDGWVTLQAGVGE